MLDTYVDAITQHIDETVEDLETLNALLQQRMWTRIERKSAERLLQTLVEAAVGVSKHVLKKQGKLVPTDAYSVFSKLAELQQLPVEDLKNWQRIVGMRNAIVHDYLNLDEKVIRTVIENKMYLFLQTYITLMAQKLIG